MKLPVFSLPRQGVSSLASSAEVTAGVIPQADPCPGFKHATCNIRAAGCLVTLPAGPAAFATCLAGVGASDCLPCWFPHI